MVFSSITFVFFFLPLVFVCFLLGGQRLRNPILLTASLFFYAWGEGMYLLVMLASILLNWCCGLLLASPAVAHSRRLVLGLGVAANLLLLSFYKYASFAVENLNILLTALHLQPVELAPVHLPIGISFFTFQAISYIVDVYTGRTSCQRNLLDLGLYISLFPQLIAGPIVRYHDIAGEIASRHLTTPDLAAGIQRFIFGLSKKVLLANPLGLAADKLFALPESELSFALAWLGAICYTLQIYYDFSGYSDMAIGLGRMFGFHFLENFNYPYISKSIREFWRRWHISLSNFLRDYLYIPLGGSRGSTAATYRNLIIVFLLCGLWHGASWTFVLWGIYHGFWLIIERTTPGRVLARAPGLFRHGLTLVIIIIGWVLFRSETLPEALGYLQAMAGLGQASDPHPVLMYLDPKIRLELTFAILLAAPVVPWLLSGLKRYEHRPPSSLGGMVTATAYLLRLTVLLALVYFTIISLAAGAYNPFIYFRF